MSRFLRKKLHKTHVMDEDRVFSSHFPCIPDFFSKPSRRLSPLATVHLFPDPASTFVDSAAALDGIGLFSDRL
jgi:hypothetical protein